MEKKVVYLRFFGELNQFFEKENQRVRTIKYKDRQTIKDILEGIGVPHTEVYFLLKENQPISFNYLVENGDFISVYPIFRKINIESSQETLRKKFPYQIKFIADAHLGKLVNYLRILGFDTLYYNDYGDQFLAEKSAEENRILLTKDHGLLMRKKVKYGYYIRNDNPKKQLSEVIHRYDLKDYINKSSRCPKCNHLLESVSKEKIIERLEPKTKKYYNEFYICTNCDQIYWKGSHFEKIEKLINDIEDEVNNGL